MMRPMEAQSASERSQVFVTRVSPEDFGLLASSWDKLLRQSSADPLFMSWPWQYSWWEEWGNKLGLELVLLAAHNGAGELQGIAPLFRHSYRTPVGFAIRRLHFIGNAWHIAPSVRTEYVGFIAKTGYHDVVVKAFFDYLSSWNWDELIVSDVVQPEVGEFNRQLAEQGGISSVVRDRALGISVGTIGPFGDWLASLGKSTRLKAYNRRSLFEALGGRYVELTGQEWEREAFLHKLNEFHTARWGKPCFSEPSIRFHLNLMKRLTAKQELRLSQLCSNRRVVSVLYDIVAGDRVYNIQAGFSEGFHQKLSLGTLHLGYAIEASFASPRISEYDLLAGAGKNTFYKSRFKGTVTEFYTMQYVKRPSLQLVYYCQAKLPRQTVAWLNRVFRF